MKLSVLLLQTFLLKQAESATLYSYAILGVNNTGEIASTGKIDVTTGNVHWTSESINRGSDAFCNVAFKKNPASYLVPAVRQGATDPTDLQLLTIRADSGTVEHIVNISKPYEYPASAFDDEHDLIWAIAIPPQGGSDIITIHAATGHVDVVKSNIGLPDIQLCEAAFLNNQFFFAWEDDTSQIIVTYDVASQQISQRHYVMCPGECRGGMNTMVPYMPNAPSDNSTHILAMAVYGGPGAPNPQVITIDPAINDTITVLATCPESTISSPQGAGAFDPISRNFYNLMLYTNNTPCCDVYYQLVTTNIDNPSYTITRIIEPGKPTSQPSGELWSIDIGE
jgi:hypothetical protein